MNIEEAKDRWYNTRGTLFHVVVYDDNGFPVARIPWDDDIGHKVCAVVEKKCCEYVEKDDY